MLTNTAVRTIPVKPLPAGKHKIEVYAMDPGFILDRIDVRLTAHRTSMGRPDSASGPVRATPNGKDKGSQGITLAIRLLFQLKMVWPPAACQSGPISCPRAILLQDQC